MMRLMWLTVCLAACATPADLYLGSDLPLSVGKPPANTDEPPATPPAVEQEPDASEPPPEPDAGPRTPDPDPPEPDAGPPARDAGPPSTLPNACAPATADCDGDAANGCEADLRRDRAHCGSCDVACQADDCQCRDGKPVAQCRTGRADCDGVAANGCEVDLQTDLNNCGACARLCHTMGHDAMSATCNAGVCEITCAVHAYPEIDCDHDPDNGCETEAWTDANNCGMCGRRCVRCEFGTCMII